MIFIMRKYAMQFLGSVLIYLVRGFSCVKETKINFLTVNANLRGPSTRKFMEIHSAKSRFICRRSFSVFHVLPLRRFTQIVPSVITGISIAVVNLIRWPFSCLMCPYQNMRTNVPTTKNYDLSPTFACYRATSFITWFNFSGVSKFPSEYSGFFIIRKALAYFSRINIDWFSHDNGILMFPCAIFNTGHI